MNGNPFEDGIVSDAWSRPVVDVPSIHRDVSDLCLATLKAVRNDGTRRSILVHGAAGSGKTHLLSRIRAAVSRDSAETPAIFCYVRLATSPSMIRRHLRRCLVRDLVRRDDAGISQFERVLLDSLSKASGAEPAAANAVSRLEQLRTNTSEWERARLAFREICGRLSLDVNLARACGFWLQRRYRNEITQWLTTGDLPDELRHKLGFKASTDEDDTSSPEQTAAEMSSQIISLITDTRPLVLCFDQMEALQLSPDDTTGFFAFGKMATDLFDQQGAVMLVTCAQSALLPQITKAIPSHDFDRLAQKQKVLNPLDESQTRELLTSRIEASAALLTDPRHTDDPSWPLGDKRLNRFLAEGDRTPRRLFSLCSELIHGGHKEAADAFTFLATAFETRREKALGLSEDTHATFIHGVSQVLAAKKRCIVKTPAYGKDVDLVASFPGRTLAFSVCNQQGQALTARLRRIANEQPKKGQERVVVRDSNRPIPRTSTKAREYLRAIAESAASGDSAPTKRILNPTPEVLAALEAIRSLLSDSRAGDLDDRGRTIQPDTVEGWIREQLLDESIEQLVAEIEYGNAEVCVEPAGIDAAMRDTVLEVLQLRHVMPMDELAEATGLDTDTIAAIASADESAFGTLGSPPAVIFERVARSASCQSN